MSNVKLARRAFTRVWAPIAERLNEGADCDAQFDGGEWSRAFNDDIWQRQYLKCLERVAPRFGITADALDQELNAAEWHFIQCIQDANKS
jgi:hypothetical protein